MNKNILLDIPSDKLLFGFDEIKKSIIHLLEEREPQYTIGIYGEWGSGKTTLMDSIYKDLLNENKENFKEMGRINSKSEFSKDKNRDTLHIPVWFNPWRYENEEHIVIPLLLQIQQTLSEALEKSDFSKNDKKNFGKNLIK